MQQFDLFFNVTKVHIITGQGADSITFDTDLPPHDAGIPDPVSLNFRVQIGTGVEYITKHFPHLVDKINVIDITQPKFKFSKR